MELLHEDSNKTNTEKNIIFFKVLIKTQHLLIIRLVSPIQVTNFYEYSVIFFENVFQLNGPIMEIRDFLIEETRPIVEDHFTPRYLTIKLNLILT